VSDVLSDAEEDVHHQRMALEPRQVVVHQPDGGAVVAVDGALLQPEGDCAAGGLRHVARAESRGRMRRLLGADGRTRKAAAALNDAVVC
jgi:hypothetical protein